MSAQDERQAIIKEELPKLIDILTGFDRDEENFKRCEQFAWYTIKNHKNLSVNSHEIKREMDGMMEKFIVGNYAQYADYLKKLYTELINNPLCINHYELDVHWSILQFLLSLSYNPVGSLKKNTLKIPLESSSSDTQSSESDEDLVKLLKEDCIPMDEEKYDSESDLSDWSVSDDFSNTQDEISKSEKGSNKSSSKIFSNIKPPEKESNFKLFDGSNSEQILLEHTQNSWWTNGRSECKVDSLHLYASFCTYWEKYVSEKSNNFIKIKPVSTASEYCLLREIIWMFHFPVDCKFFYVNSDGEMSVRENLSIPSVITEGLQCHLESLIPYIRMLNKLRGFIHSVYFYDEKPPPKMYEYYASSLESILQPFYEELLHQEEIIKEQAPFEIRTIIQFEHNMRQSFNYLEKIYDIHISSVLNFKIVEAHICSAHLLAGFMLKFQMGNCLMTCNLAIALFLSTVKGFCNIIDNWWTEGLLDDWRNEFLVERISAELEDIYTRAYVKSRESAAFVPSEISNVIKNDAFLKLIVEHSLEAGCTLNLLYLINKIGDLKIAGNFEKKFYDIFIQDIFEDIENFQEDTLLLFEEDKEVEKVTNQTDNKVQTSEGKHSFVCSAVPSIDDEFLRIVFHYNLNIEHNENNKICEKNTKETNALEIYEKLKSTSTIVLPMEEIILKCMSRILQARMSRANMFVMRIYREEFGVLRHLKNIRRVLLLESSDLLNYFYRKLFTEIESGKEWANPFLLTVQLDDIMCSKYPDVSSLFCVRIGSYYKCQTLKVVDAVDELTINYDVQKEVGIIITQKSLEEYNKVFRFLLKVKWSLWTLENLQFPLSYKNRTPYIGLQMADILMRRLAQIRLWIMYTLQNIHFHLMTHVLHSMGERLDKNIQNCTNLAEMKSVHDSYIKTVSEHCFTNSDNGDIKRAIEQLFNLVHILRVEWTSCVREIDHSGTSDSFAENSFNYLENAQVDGIVSTYVNCHTFLSKVLSHEVYVNQHSYFSALSAAISSSLPG